MKQNIWLQKGFRPSRAYHEVINFQEYPAGILPIPLGGYDIKYTENGIPKSIAFAYTNPNTYQGLLGSFSDVIILQNRITKINGNFGDGNTLEIDYDNSTFFTALDAYPDYQQRPRLPIPGRSGTQTPAKFFLDNANYDYNNDIEYRNGLIPLNLGATNNNTGIQVVSGSSRGFFNNMRKSFAAKELSFNIQQEYLTPERRDFFKKWMEENDDLYVYQYHEDTDKTYFLKVKLKGGNTVQSTRLLTDNTEISVIADNAYWQDVELTGDRFEIADNVETELEVYNTYNDVPFLFKFIPDIDLASIRLYNTLSRGWYATGIFQTGVLVDGTQNDNVFVNDVQVEPANFFQQGSPFLLRNDYSIIYFVGTTGTIEMTWRERIL